MNARLLGIAAAVAVPLFAAPAGAQFPQCLAVQNESVIVEPLNKQFVQIGSAGAENASVAVPVPCALSLSGCYEFGVLPVTYSGPTSPTVQEVGSLTDPIQGTVVVELSTIGPPGPIPSGTWDGASSAQMIVDPTFDASLTTQLKNGAKIQIPADFVPANPATATTGVLALVRATHTPPAPDPVACGQFQLVKRNLAGNQALAKASEAAPTPVLFIRQAVNTENEVLLVEALNTQFVLLPLGAGAQTVFQNKPVKRPANQCCFPNDVWTVAQCGADPTSTTLVDCYEFAMTYISYDASGNQVLHLPTFPDPAVPDAIEAPIVGDIFVRILPVNNQPLTFFQSPFAMWDGVSTNSGQVFIYTQMNGGPINANTTYTLPTIRIPSAAVPAVLPPGPGGPGTVVGLVEALHQPLQTGFFSAFKRAFVWSQDLGNLHDALASPMTFPKASQSPDDLEVILVEPLDLAKFNIFGIGGQTPVAQCRNVGGIDVFRFGITYVTYGVGAVEVHQKSPAAFPIVGGLKITIQPDLGASSGPSGVWDQAATATLIADTSGDLNFGVQLFTQSALVLVEKDDLLSSLPPLPGLSNIVVGNVLGTHCEQTDCDPAGLDSNGFHHLIKRNFVHNQGLGNAMDQLPTPILFEKSATCAPAP